MTLMRSGATILFHIDITFLKRSEQISMPLNILLLLWE